MLKRRITLIGLSCAVPGVPCLALDLGPVQQQSYVDEPLLATVEILDAGELDVGSISVVAADSADFAERGLSVKNFIGDLETEVIRTAGKAPFVQLSSTEPVQSAILNFALKAQWENGSVIQQYTVLMKDPPADNVENFSEDGALSALSDLEMLESEAMSTQQEDNNETVWNLDNNLANRTEWQVSDERSLREIAVHIRPSNIVSIEQTLVALIKKNAAIVQQRQSLALNESDVVKLPTQAEISSINKLSAGHELGALQARFQISESAANEAGQIAAKSAREAAYTPAPMSRLRLGRPEQAIASNTESVEEPMKQQSSARTKSTDLARRLENAVARLGDANHVINTHIREINELNLLVEDLKHTIDLKNSELADMQARALGAIQAQDSVENLAKAAVSGDLGTEKLAAHATNEISLKSDSNAETVESSSSGTATHSVLGGFLAMLAAMFSIITFARVRARISESRAAKATAKNEQASEEMVDDSVQHMSLQFEDPELQKMLDKQNGSVVGEAEVLTAHGFHSQAIAHLQAALDESPESSELIGALREALILSGKYEQAAELFPDLESANDNAVIDSEYIKQPLVIDDLEEPFDESKPPVWEPPAASIEHPAAVQSNVTESKVESANNNVSAEKSAAKNVETKKTTAAEKAAARKESRRAKKAKAAKRQQASKVVKAKKTSTASEKKQPVEELKVQLEEVVATESEAVVAKPLQAASTMVVESDVQANQQTEDGKNSSDTFVDNSDIFTEVEATPFELVQAYIELDDREGARRMLEDILGDGKPNEKARAKELLEEIA